METNLDTKLTQLTMAVKGTGKILDAGKREPLNGISKRYKQSLKKQTSAKALLKRKKLTIKKIFQKLMSGTLKSKAN